MKTKARELWARPEVRWLALITVAGAALRFATLGLQSYSYDEIATTDLVLRHGFWATMKQVHLTESTPPFYYALAWVWTQLFGQSEWGLRSLSALAGTAVIPFAYVAGAAFSTKRVGFIAALLAAFNPALFWYSQQARAYILLVLLTTAGIAFFALALRDRQRDNDDGIAEAGGAPGRWLLWWAVASGLALATHYFAVFSVAPEAAWLLWVMRKDRRVWFAISAVGVVGLALLPLASSQESAGHAGFIANLDFVRRLERTPTLFLGGPQLGIKTVSWVGLGMVTLATGGLLWRSDRKNQLAAGTCVLLAAGVLITPLVAKAAGHDYFYARNELAALVPLLLIVAVAFGAGVPKRVGIAAAAVLTVCFLGLSLRYDFDRDWQRSDWRWVSQEAGTPEGSRVTVVNSFGDLPLEHYSPLERLGTPTISVREVLFAGAGLSKQVSHSTLPPAFKLVDEGTRGGISFRLYRADAPTTVRKDDVTGPDLRFYGEPIVLYDTRGE